MFTLCVCVRARHVQLGSVQVQFGCCCGRRSRRGFGGRVQMDPDLGGCEEQVTFNYINVSIALSVFSLPPFSPRISICPSVFLLPPALVGRKIKVFCFLREIFVSAFWLYLKIKLSLARCLSLRVCKPSSVLAGVI